MREITRGDVVARIHGALLVAPVGSERQGALADFAPAPYQPLPYSSILVAGANDPYCPVRSAGAYAHARGSEFVRLENARHINIEAGFGLWPFGAGFVGCAVSENSLTKGRECCSSISP